MNVNELRLYKDGYIRGIEEMILALEFDYVSAPIGDNIIQIKITDDEKAKLIGYAMSTFNYEISEMFDEELFDLPDFDSRDYQIMMEDLPEYLKDILKGDNDEI